jgi:hypothetical protein
MKQILMCMKASVSLGMALSLTAACGDSEKTQSDDSGADQSLGDTALVTVVNPIENEGHTADAPSAYDTAREGIAVDAEPGDSAMTDPTGLAVLDDVGEGELSLTFGGRPSMPFSVIEAGDVYDLAVAYDGSAVEIFPNFPIRYAVGGTIIELGSDADAGEVAEALGTDDSLVFFRTGSYVGDLTITGENVIFFGEGFAERDVVIDGSVLVSGGNVRIRGFTITGNVVVNGNTFGMAYSVVRGSTDIRGNAVAFLRNSFCGTVRVPSSSASLLDNRGMAPLNDVTPAECP